MLCRDGSETPQFSSFPVPPLYTDLLLRISRGLFGELAQRNKISKSLLCQTLSILGFCTCCQQSFSHKCKSGHSTGSASLRGKIAVCRKSCSNISATVIRACRSGTPSTTTTRSSGCPSRSEHLKRYSSEKLGQLQRTTLRLVTFSSLIHQLVPVKCTVEGTSNSSFDSAFRALGRASTANNVSTASSF